MASEVPQERARNITLLALQNGRPTFRARRVIALVGLAAFFNLALAASADSAIPGDLLYPVDRGFEKIETLFGFDHRQERISEAHKLSEKHQNSEAIQMVIESLGADAPAELRTALEASRNGVETSGDAWNTFSQSTNRLIESVQNMYTYEHQHGTPSQDQAELVRERAREVAQAAQGLKKGQSEDSPSVTSPGRSGEGSPSATAPGRSDNPAGAASLGNSSRLIP